MKKNVYDKALKSKSFCIYPFIHMATKTDGTFRLCCRSEKISSIRKTSAVELWNSDKYKKIRCQLFDGEKPEECKSCWSMESVGTTSMRQRAFKGHLFNYFSLLKKVDIDGTVPFLPKSIELKLSNLCNLRCRMCHPVDSSSWAKDWTLVEDLMKKHTHEIHRTAKKQNISKNPFVSAFKDERKWWQDFEKIADSLEIVKFVGGEPLIDPLHYKVLDLLKKRASEIKLDYSSNLTHLSFKGTSILDYWKNFKSVWLFASVDGIGDLYDYIRTGAKFSKVEANLNRIVESQSVCFEEIGVLCTIQIYNTFQLPKIMDYFSRKKIYFHSNRVIHPAFLNSQVLPKKLKDQATKSLLEYREKLYKEKPFEDEIIENLNHHIQDHLSHMNGRDCSYLLPDFVDYTKRMDQSTGTHILSVVPELKDLFYTAPV